MYDWQYSDHLSFGWLKCLIVPSSVLLGIISAETYNVLIPGLLSTVLWSQQKMWISPVIVIFRTVEYVDSIELSQHIHFIIWASLAISLLEFNICLSYYTLSRIKSVSPGKYSNMHIKRSGSSKDLWW